VDRRIKVATIVGARPQFIKAAAVSRALERTGTVDEVLVHTGQHYDRELSALFFEQLGLRAPRHELGVGSGPHGQQTGRMLEAVERVLVEERPDWVLVYGDTNSTLAGALAAVKLHLPCAHVESGLRSHNRRMPEEINRIVADHVCTLLFVPTDLARDNLRAEGLPAERIRLVGDVMFDCALQFGRRAEAESRILPSLGLAPGEFVLATVHRAENTDDPARLRAIIEALDDVARDRPVVLPLHPRTRSVLAAAGWTAEGRAGFHVLPPVGFLDMLMLERNAAVVATDSGGVQKEAFFYGVPCVTLRDETEWVELVELGWNEVVPPVDARRVAERIRAAVGRRGTAAQPYGDGRAGERIAEALGERRP
jgi:UDP-GlcNAc3NAcA epimerase